MKFCSVIVCAIAAALYAGQALAASAVPAQVLSDLRNAAAIAKQDEARVERMSGTTSDPQLAARMRDESRRQSATTFSYIVNSAIASNPQAAQAIVSAAISVAPELREAITQSALVAFPGFASQINSARPGNYAAEKAEIQPVAHTGVIPAPRPPAPQEYVHPPASTPNENPIWDPWQPVNRPLFAVYQFVDDFLIRPIAAGYGWITPGPVKKGVRNAFRNLDSPVVFANDLLQFQPGDAAVTLGRFILNSTAGGLGFFDVAARAGLPGHPADFDQTLNFYHVPSGPYMILPVLGPGTVRHNLARIVDGFADPMSWSNEVDRAIKIGRTAGYMISTRENLIEPLDTLRKDSLDWYATFRATYYQDRAVVLRKGATTPGAAQNDAFDAAQ
ncbi:MAG TPA: VacJ family lipoprotein [Alphaproteobacteria bacterium]|nr:VacJ family lipoprotein [Alphaproteobacteria bacterium]